MFSPTSCCTWEQLWRTPGCNASQTLLKHLQSTRAAAEFLTEVFISRIDVPVNCICCFLLVGATKWGIYLTCWLQVYFYSFFFFFGEVFSSQTVCQSVSHLTKIKCLSFLSRRDKIHVLSELLAPPSGQEHFLSITSSPFCMFLFFLCVYVLQQSLVLQHISQVTVDI